MTINDLCLRTYYVVLPLAAVTGLCVFKSLTISLRIFSAYVAFSVLAEITAYLSSLYFHNNMPVYCIYSMLQFMFMGVYFNESVAIFKKHNVGIWIGLAGVLLGILNTIYLQPIKQENVYFLFFEGIATIGLVLFSFARIMIDGTDQKILHNPHFWIGGLLVFYWSITFCNWALYNYTVNIIKRYGMLVNFSIVLVNVIFYAGLTMIFILFSKPKYNNG